MRRLAPCVLPIAMLLAFGPSRPAASEERWNIDVQTSSLEAVLLHPEEILADPDAFWASDAAYVLSRKWHDNVGLGLDAHGYYDKWLAKLKRYAEIPADERRQSEAFDLVQELRARIPRFRAECFPLLDGFLPDNGLVVRSTIHLTTGTLSYGFMTNGQIVQDPLSDYYEGDPDRIFNLLTHEAFHLGYGYNRHLRRETPLDDPFQYDTMLDALHNEGLATWVGYRTRSIFPAENDPDFLMLDDPAEVQRHRRAVNSLMQATATTPVDSLREDSWEIGVMQRGYYILGAHMARTIEERRGREALVETIAIGPRGFVDAYNALVEEDQRVVTLPAPTETGLLPRLKSAATRGDREEFDRVAAEMHDRREELHPQTRRLLERFGYGLLRIEDHAGAIDVFELEVALFPQEANAYDCLAEAHLENGDRTNARRFYRKALEVDPDWENAKKKLAELE